MAKYEPFIDARITEWAYWIRAREDIRIRKEELEKAPPWHKDPVMANTRWCNVRRMDDKVSRWMLDEWYSPGDMSPRDALLAGLMARMINKPDTLHAITGGKRFSRFDYDRAYKAMYEVKASGETVFTNAYIINGASGGPKIDQVLNAIRKAANSMGNDRTGSRYVDLISLQTTAEKLHDLPGVGSFIAGQVVADLRWVLLKSNYWQDRMKWAPPGPGSSRGMKYLIGEIDAEGTAGRGKDMGPKQFLKLLPKLVDIAQRHPVVAPIFEDRQLEAHDIQNTLCETSKFVRIKYGVGRAKNQYNWKDGWL